VQSITSSKDEVKIISRDGVMIVLICQDAHAFIAAMNKVRDEAAAQASVPADLPPKPADETKGEEGDGSEEVMEW
jgi:hypothetical protein